MGLTIPAAIPQPQDQKESLPEDQRESAAERHAAAERVLGQGSYSEGNGSLFRPKAALPRKVRNQPVLVLRGAVGSAGNRKGGALGAERTGALGPVGWGGSCAPEGTKKGPLASGGLRGCQAPDLGSAGRARRLVEAAAAEALAPHPSRPIHAGVWSRVHRAPAPLPVDSARPPRPLPPRGNGGNGPRPSAVPAHHPREAWP